MTDNVLNADLEITEDIEASKTYKLSVVKLQGNTDGLEALQQAIYKILNTEKYEYPIYSFNYGIELENLIGKDVSYVMVELKRRIQECLLEDERILTVDNFSFSTLGDTMQCSFNVATIYGDTTLVKEVNL